MESGTKIKSKKAMLFSKVIFGKTSSKMIGWVGENNGKPRKINDWTQITTMIYLPVTLILFLILLLLLPFIWFVLAIDVVQVAAAKLGFSRGTALLLFILIIIGGAGVFDGIALCGLFALLLS